MSIEFIRRRNKKRAFILATAGVAAAAFGSILLRQESVATISPAPHAAAGKIVARGRIEPLGRVVAINGPTDGTIIRQLLVDQGSKVEVGQVLAILDGYDVRRAELALAERNLRLAELQRAQVKAGAKHSDIAAQSDVVSAKKAQFLRLQKEWERRTALFSNRVISRETLDKLKADLDQADSEVGQARNALKSLTEVRSIDDEVAAARIEVEKATVARTRADMERLLIHAPGPGTVLSIQARAGEAIQADGILRMADLDHVIAVAEIDESEIGQVVEGMQADIEGTILPQPVKASVSRIAHEVFRQKRPSSDILIGRDARIVEVELTPQTPLPTILGGEVAVHLTPAGMDRR